jgi:ribosome-binding ATPase YchF (GTP1/OBG family)
MKVGIVGFAGCGKTTVFQWLTGKTPDPAAVTRGGQVGEGKIPDERLDWLIAHFKPRKEKYAELVFVDTPGLMPTERRDNPRRLGILRDANGLLVVLNGYSGDDLAGEMRRFQEELLFADLEIITNRLDKLKDLLKKPRPAKQKELDQEEQALLQRIATALEEGKPASTVGLRDEEEKAIRSFQLLTLKPQVALVNHGDSLIGKPAPAELAAQGAKVLMAPAKLEMELQDLPEADRAAFAADLGLTEFSSGQTLREIYAAMGQTVFFTVGEDECRAWGIPKGATAVEGAGQIHTDLARGFVRAEVVSFADFRRVGSMKEAKAQGVYHLQGKTYVVQDGDIMHILASG